MLSQEYVFLARGGEKYTNFTLLPTFEVETTMPSKCYWEREKALTAKVT